MKKVVVALISFSLLFQPVVRPVSGKEKLGIAGGLSLFIAGGAVSVFLAYLEKRMKEQKENERFSQEGESDSEDKFNDDEARVREKMRMIGVGKKLSGLIAGAGGLAIFVTAVLAGMSNRDTKKLLKNWSLTQVVGKPGLFAYSGSKSKHKENLQIYYTQTQKEDLILTFIGSMLNANSKAFLKQIKDKLSFVKNKEIKEIFKEELLGKLKKNKKFNDFTKYQQLLILFVYTKNTASNFIELIDSNIEGDLQGYSEKFYVKDEELVGLHYKIKNSNKNESFPLFGTKKNNTDLQSEFKDYSLTDLNEFLEIIYWYLDLSTKVVGPDKLKFDLDHIESPEIESCKVALRVVYTKIQKGIDNDTKALNNISELEEKITEIEWKLLAHFIYCRIIRVMDWLDQNYNELYQLEKIRYNENFKTIKNKYSFMLKKEDEDDD